MKISIIKIQLSQTINWYFLITMSPHPWISRTRSKNTVPFWTLGCAFILIFGKTSSNSLYMLQCFFLYQKMFQNSICALSPVSMLINPFPVDAALAPLCQRPAPTRTRRRQDLWRGLGIAIPIRGEPKRGREPPRPQRHDDKTRRAPGSPSLPAQHFSLNPAG